MGRSKRILTAAAAIAVLMAAFAVPAQASEAGTLLSRINSSRAAAGKAPVQTYWDLTDDARAHTNAMIASGGIYHSPSLSGVTGVWLALGENVGVGTDANQLHDAFMASSSHRANILGDYNYVGIGAVEDDNGMVWATVIFMRAEPGLNAPAEETTTTTVAPTTTTTTVAPTQNAVPASAPATTTTTSPTPSTTTTTRAPSSSGEPSDPEPVVSKFPAYGRPDGLPAFAI